jgi:quercetin dioxygenase-like cupin family protein
MYFSVAGSAMLRGGCGLVITREAYRGFFHVGGPIEETGRLRYIDGCTDSLLIPPVKLGDACLNLLHIPPGTRQSAHTHPSIRVGLIVRGTGNCVTPEHEFALRPGLAFVIAADQLHSFHTENDSLLVVAYHPDSDFGPTDECHPMVNRTILPPWTAAGSAASPPHIGDAAGNPDAEAAEQTAVHRKEDGL